MQLLDYFVNYSEVAEAMQNLRRESQYKYFMLWYTDDDKFRKNPLLVLDYIRNVDDSSFNCTETQPSVNFTPPQHNTVVQTNRLELTDADESSSPSLNTPHYFSQGLVTSTQVNQSLSQVQTPDFFNIPPRADTPEPLEYPLPPEEHFNPDVDVKVERENFSGEKSLDSDVEIIEPEHNEEIHEIVDSQASMLDSSHNFIPARRDMRSSNLERIFERDYTQEDPQLVAINSSDESDDLIGLQKELLQGGVSQRDFFANQPVS